MTTDNRTNELTPEQIIEDALRNSYASGSALARLIVSDLHAHGLLAVHQRREDARRALTAAQSVLDLEKVAAVIDREFDDYQPMYPADGSRCIDSNAARALCEAAKRGELTR